MCWLGGTPEALSVLGINGFDSLPPEDENGKTKKNVSSRFNPYLRLIGLGRCWLWLVGWLCFFPFLGVGPTREKGRNRQKATQRFKLAIKLIKVQAPPMHDNLL